MGRRSFGFDVGTRKLSTRLLASAAIILALCGVIMGCNVNLSVNQGDSTSSNGGGTEATTNGTTSSGSQQASASAPSSTSPAVPSGYVLDQNCEKGSGSTGLDIYYTQPPADSLRFACVRRSDKSPYINFDEQFDQNLADVGGPYCAFSQVDQNVGCALEPITEKDLMNVPPTQEEEVPSGYVLEDCQQGVGATGKTIYYRPPLPPGPGRMHTYWFECVHRTGASPIVNVVSSPSSGNGPTILGSGGPYCAFSTVDKNIGCALSPITEEDLMNPPSKEQEQQPTSDAQSSGQQTSSGDSAGVPRALCKDGYISDSQNSSGTCSNHGGVAKWLY